MTSDWAAWIGRQDVLCDHVDRERYARWLATLDRDALAEGAPQQAFHWCLCLPSVPTAQLGIDGHPRRVGNDHGLLPPIALPRRMWASSQVRFLAPLRIGHNVIRTSRLVSISRKRGGDGELVFVEIEHATRMADILCISETQTVVFREAVAPDAPPMPPSAGADRFESSGWDLHRTVVPSEQLLFRYSALTFNAHRIHYDFSYATADEGYRGLVVHGPLVATLLLDLAGRRFGDNRLRQFDFRATSPAICGDDLNLVLRGRGDAVELAAFAADGRQIMAATARV